MVPELTPPTNVLEGSRNVPPTAEIGTPPIIIVSSKNIPSFAYRRRNSIPV